MTSSRDYVRLEIVAYRLDGEDGWRVRETEADTERFKSDLLDRGLPVVEVRSIISGIRCAALDENNGSLDEIGCHLIIGQGWTWDDVAGCWRAPGEMVRRMPGQSAAVDDIQIVFDAPEAGWQPVSIAAGGKIVRFDASEVYDPFPDILSWLEAIARGDQGRVSANLEGSELELFAFTLSDPTRVRIVMAFLPGRNGDARDVHLDIDVDRRRFIGAFYGSFRAYADSDRYIIDEWAALSMRDDLIRKGFPGDPIEMASCDAVLLNDLLWKLYPSYLVSFPSAATKGEELVRFAEHVKSGECPEDMVTEPDPQFVVPDDFDTWDDDRRLDCINDLLNEVVTPYHGSNLKTLRSSIIEAFLGDGR